MQGLSTSPALRTFSPRDVARALGVSEASIKRWCDQGEFQVVKTPGGHRRIPLSSVLDHLRRHRRPLEQADALGLPVAVAGTAAPAAPAKEAQHLVLAALESGSYDALRDQCWIRYLQGESLVAICDRLLSHAFEEIGDRWSHGTTEVYQERRACEITLRLLNELRSALPPIAPDAPRAIGCTLEGDPYELPTRMAELVLLERGWRAQSLGANIPGASATRAIQREAPKLLWISVSAFDDLDRLRTTLEPLYQAASSQACVLALGGRALRDDIRRHLPYSFFGDSLEHLVSYADSLRLGTQRSSK